jgi:hypothetical protein
MLKARLDAQRVHEVCFGASIRREDELRALKQKADDPSTEFRVREMGQVGEELQLLAEIQYLESKLVVLSRILTVARAAWLLGDNTVELGFEECEAFEGEFS